MAIGKPKGSVSVKQILKALKHVGAHTMTTKTGKVVPVQSYMAQYVQGQRNLFGESQAQMSLFDAIGGDEPEEKPEEKPTDPIVMIREEVKKEPEEKPEVIDETDDAPQYKGSDWKWTDVGEFLANSSKEKAAIYRTLRAGIDAGDVSTNTSDVDTIMDDKKMRMLLERGALWRIDPLKMREMGISSGAAQLIKVINDATPATVPDDVLTKEQIERYISGFKRVEEAFHTCRTVDDVVIAAQELHEEHRGRNYGDEYREIEKRYDAIKSRVSKIWNANGSARRHAYALENIRSATNDIANYQTELRRLQGADLSNQSNVVKRATIMGRMKVLEKDIAEQQAIIDQNEAIVDMYRDDPDVAEYQKLSSERDVLNDQLYEIRQARREDSYARRVILESLGKRFENQLERLAHHGYISFRDSKAETEQRQKMANMVLSAKEAEADDNWSWTGIKKTVKRREKDNDPWNWTRASNDNPERTGGAIAAQNSLEILNTFSLRGLQYGNTVTESEREHHSKWLGWALSDLADVLGVQPGDISRNGRLGMRIGANGHGNARAHYEPTLEAINITKRSGGGSVAHEWGHFLDHSLHSAGQALTDYVAKTPTHRIHALNDPVKSAMAEVWDAMANNQDRSARIPGKTMQPEADTGAKWTQIDKYLSQHGDPQAAFNAIAHDYSTTKQDVLDKIAQHLANKTGKPVRSVIQKKGFRDSMFHTAAKAMGEYWRRPHEMFARCFETYIEHKMHEAGRRNTYLVGDEYGGDKTTLHGNIYPQGAERERIVAAMDKLMDVIRSNGMLQKAMLSAIKMLRWAI